MLDQEDVQVLALVGVKIAIVMIGILAFAAIMGIAVRVFELIAGW